MFTADARFFDEQDDEFQWLCVSYMTKEVVFRSTHCRERNDKKIINWGFRYKATKPLFWKFLNQILKRREHIRWKLHRRLTRHFRKWDHYKYALVVIDYQMPWKADLQFLKERRENCSRASLSL
jgi:hypothetical protein